MNPAEPKGTWRSLSLHLCCVAWILLVAWVSLARHRDLPQLRREAAEGPATERIEALATLRQREDDVRFLTVDPRQLLISGSPLLAEFAFTNTFTRSPQQRLTDADLLQLADPRARSRAGLWLHGRTTTPRRITLSDLDTWFSEDQP